MAKPNAESFQRALDRFKQSISPDLAKDFSICSLSHVQQVCKEIQQKHGNEGKLRYMGRLRGFIEAMEQFGKVIEIFVNASEIVCFIWRPIKFILLAASTHLDSFDRLLDVYAQIGDAIPGLQRYEATFIEHPPLATVLEDYYSDILQFHRIALSVFKRPTWKDMYHSLWKTFDSKFSPILHSLCKRRELLESEKSSAALYEIQRLRKDISTTHKECRQQIDEERRKNHKAQISHIKERLEAPNYGVDQEMATENILIDGSGDWIFKNNEFQAWRSPVLGHSVLYINGIPGAGKTTLVSSVIRKLLDDKHSATVSYYVAYFYFKHQQPGKKSHNSLLRSILDQLIIQDPAMSDHMFKKISVMDSPSLRLTKTLEALVKEALGCHQISYIVVDGLDESTPKEAERSVEWLLSLVKGRSRNTTTSLRILFCGQRDGVLDNLLADEPSISLESSAHTEDIKGYCSRFCERIGDKFGISQEFQNDIACRISNGANGMFLYARVVLENLLGQTRLSGLKSEIQPGIFPEGIEKAYERVAVRIFEGSSSSQCEDAKKVLGWITCAGRLLRWREIQSSFCITPTKAIVEYEESRLRVTCKELCGSLVDVHSTSNKRGDPEDIIKIVHETAREYLIRRNWINVTLMHADHAIFCSHYLTSEPFECSINKEAVYNHAVEGYYALQDYAVQYWFYHTKKCAELSGKLNPYKFQAVMESVRRLLTSYSFLLNTDKCDEGEDSEVLRVLTELPDDERDRNTHFNIELRTLYIRRTIETVQFTALDPATQEICTNLHGEMTSYKCSKPWCASFATGYENSDDRKRHIDRHDLPFCCAFEGCLTYLLGFDTQAKLDQHIKLYHHKTDDKLEFPKPPSKKLPSLETLIKGGDLTGLKLRLSSGADIKTLEAKSSSRNTLLHTAVTNGHFEICEFLLQQGANINAIGFRRRTPLHSAAFKGHVEIVRLLLSQEGCLVDEVNSDGSSPFLTACRTGNLAIVKLLAKTGKVQASRRDDNRLSPLGYASRSGHLPIVLYLLQEMQHGPVTRETLADAAVNGHKSVAEALLPIIASSSQDSSPNTPYYTGFPLHCVKLGVDRLAVFNQYITPRLLDVDFIHIPDVSTAESATFSHCGRYIALARNHAIGIYDIVKKEYTENLKHDGVEHPMGRMSFSPDGKYLTTVTTKLPPSVTIWDMALKSHRITHDITTGSVQSIYFRADGSIFLIVSVGGLIQLLNAVSDSIETTLSSGTLSLVVGASISSNGKYLVAASEDGTFSIWNVATRQLQQQFVECMQRKGLCSSSSPIAFSPRDENVFCYTTAEGPRLGKIEGDQCTRWTPKSRNSHVSFSKITRRIIYHIKTQQGNADISAFTFDANLLMFDKSSSTIEFLDIHSGLSHFLIQGQYVRYFGRYIVSSPTQGLFAIGINDKVNIFSYRYLRN
ncbi:WD40 repeat-like protein [Daldinia grandis]|nr:WD40 repeat-like protein [Daldinia grandis]